MTFATRQRFELDLVIPAADWEGSFDKLEVWRARVSAAGPYEPLHGNSWAPARLPRGFTGGATGGSGPSTVLVGKTVEFLVNELTPVVVSFTGSDPLTFAQAAAQIAAQSGSLLSSFVSGGVLVVATTQAGVIAVLRCTGGQAAPSLGLNTAEPDSLGFGQDARIVLVHGQEQYGFVDPDGSSSFYYKIRLYNSVNGLVSEFTPPFQGRSGGGLASADLVLGYVDLVDMTGGPARNRVVLLSNTFNGTQIGGKTVSGGDIRLTTDNNGHAEAFLPRGSKVVVSIEGTSLARDVDVPSDPAIDTINLFDSTVSRDDLFTVQVPNIDYAVRRTL